MCLNLARLCPNLARLDRPQGVLDPYVVFLQTLGSSFGGTSGTNVARLGNYFVGAISWELSRRGYFV